MNAPNVKIGDIVFIIDYSEMDNITFLQKGSVSINYWKLGTLLNIERDPSNKFLIESSGLLVRRNIIIPFEDFNPHDYGATIAKSVTVQDSECIRPLWT